MGEHEQAEEESAHGQRRLVEMELRVHANGKEGGVCSKTIIIRKQTSKQASKRSRTREGRAHKQFLTPVTLDGFAGLASLSFLRFESYYSFLFCFF